MVFSRDWDEASPIDHTLNREWPSKDRNIKVDISDRIKSWIAGFISGEATAGVKFIPFIDQAGNPSTITDQFLLFGKAVGGKTELHLKDEDGNVEQATSGGKIRSLALKASAVADIANLMELIYPVGHIYISYVSTNPGTLLGIGTWSVFGAGKFLISIDSSDTDFDSAGETGGSKTKTLTASEIPELPLTISSANNNSGAGDGEGAVEAQIPNINSTISGGSNKANSGVSAAAFSIMPPFIAVYMWRRTA